MQRCMPQGRACCHSSARVRCAQAPAAVPPRDVHKAEQSGVPAQGTAISKSLTGLAIHDLGGLHPALATSASCVHPTYSKLWPGVPAVRCSKQCNIARSPWFRRPLCGANPVSPEGWRPICCGTEPVQKTARRRSSRTAAGLGAKPAPAAVRLGWQRLGGRAVCAFLSCADAATLPGCLCRTAPALLWHSWGDCLTSRQGKDAQSPGS